MLTVVTGPPCGGKSTWIRARAQPGDIIVDLDRIALAITTEDTEHHAYPEHIRRAAQAARRSLIATAVGMSRQIDVWIIETKPSRSLWLDYKNAGATFVKCDPGRDVVMARASRERPAWVLDYITTYYA